MGRWRWECRNVHCHRVSSGQENSDLICTTPVMDMLRAEKWVGGRGRADRSGHNSGWDLLTTSGVLIRAVNWCAVVVMPFQRFLRVCVQTFKLGQFVDVVANSAQQKGMPYKYYHGKTGRVWNISRRAIGVVITKVRIVVWHGTSHRVLLLMIFVNMQHKFRYANAQVVRVLCIDFPIPSAGVSSLSQGAHKVGSPWSGMILIHRPVLNYTHVAM